MPVTVLIPADSRRLATLADVESDIGSDAIGSSALTIEAMLDQSSAALERACSRIFAQQLYEETFQPAYDWCLYSAGGLYARGQYRLFLSRVPVVSIRSITAGGEPITDYRVENPESGILWRQQGWGYGWGDDAADDLKVKYIAGYILPEQTNAVDLLEDVLATEPLGDPLPADVRRLTIESTKVWFHEREPGTRVASRHMGDQSISYVVSAGKHALPPFVLEGLKSWKRWVVR